MPQRVNRLIHEKSPYLLQHAHNPVDWYPWGEEALARARAERKPILLSIGYSACHWCHVMERECFENEAIAALMNEHFINIKVDREERPDLDDIYQKAAQLLSRQGGWPLTVFLTPDLRPFYAGTYFPPTDRFGRPGFPRVLETISRVFREEPERVEQTATQVSAAIGRLKDALGRADAALRPELIDAARAQLWSEFDWENGGFGDAPKFPNAAALELLLRTAAPLADRQPPPEAASEPLPEADRAAGPTPEAALKAVTYTLHRMAAGGIYDQLGGGFHRYSVDAAWAVPHFEKMLYDNALLTVLYVHAYQLTREPTFAAVVRDTLGYVQREMTHPDGGFFASQDADSEGEEGRFFVWSPAEVHAALGHELGELACAYFGVTEAGNFEGGSTVLHRAQSIAAL
ncbi:MAG TPA: thioredoxin domain-containing protein, partial [Limnochordia bacterium]